MPQLLSQTNGITQGEGDFWKDKRDLRNINNPTQQGGLSFDLDLDKPRPTNHRSPLQLHQGPDNSMRHDDGSVWKEKSLSL